MDDLSHLTRLPYRRLGGGYEREAVHYILRELEDRIRRLDQLVEQSRGRSSELEQALEAARAEISGLRAREAEVAERVESAQRRATEIEQAAHARASAIVAEAEAQAARTHGEVHLRMEEAGRQLDELLRLRRGMLDSLRKVVGDVAHALDRIERGEPLGADVQPEPAPAPARDALRLADDVLDVVAHVGSAEPAVPGDDQILGPHVEVEAGPFGDFAAISSFERALGRLPKVEDVYIRRFSDDRAAIELTLAEPMPLLAVMRRTLPWGFDVEHADAREVRLNVRSASLANSR